MWFLLQVLVIVINVRKTITIRHIKMTLQLNCKPTKYITKYSFVNQTGVVNVAE